MDASYKIQRGIHVHLIQFFMCPEFWVHIKAMSRLDFLYRTELPHRAVAVYIYLADRTNENNECWPAIPTIAADLKYSPSTVRRGIRDLKKAGLLETEQRYRKKGGKSSLLFRLKAE